MPAMAQPKKVAQAPSKSVEMPHADGWINTTTGLGSGRDKNSSTTYAPDARLQWQTLAEMYNGDYLAQRIVEMRPKEMFRKGYILHLEGREDDVKALRNAAERLELDAQLLEGLIMGRLFGGALMYWGIDDRAAPEEPLDITSIRAIRFLRVIDIRFLRTDETSVGYQGYRIDPESYIIGVSGERVHKSRAMRFEGGNVDVSRRIALNGWTYSVLQPVFSVLQRYASTMQSLSALIADAQQGVFKLKGLWEMVSSKNKEALQARMALVDQSRSSTRSLLLDTDGEDFHREPTNFSGLPEAINIIQAEVASAAKQPQTLLFGRSPAGMNATGDADFRAWFDSVEVERQTVLMPLLRRSYDIIGAALGIDVSKLEIEFPPLWELTALEQAQVRLATSQADALDIANGVLQPEEVAISRYGSGKYNPTTVAIDVDKLRSSLAANVTFEDPNAAEIQSS